MVVHGFQHAGINHHGFAVITALFVGQCLPIAKAFGHVGQWCVFGYQSEGLGVLPTLQTQCIPAIVINSAVALRKLRGCLDGNMDCLKCQIGQKRLLRFSGLNWLGIGAAFINIVDHFVDDKFGRVKVLRQGGWLVIFKPGRL